MLTPLTFKFFLTCCFNFN